MSTNRVRQARKHAKRLDLGIRQRGEEFDVRDDTGAVVASGTIEQIESFMDARSPVDKPAPSPSAASMPGAAYGMGVSYLDEHCRGMLRAGRAQRTVKMRRMHLQYLAEYLGRDPVDTTMRELEDWQDRHPVEQLRFKTAMVRPYFDYLHKRGIRPDNPAALLVTPRAKRGLPRPIVFESLERAIRTAPTPRLRAWLILAAYAGLRAKEVAHLEMDCFEESPDGGVFIRLTRTKGEHARVSALPAWAWELIRPALAPTGLCFRRERGIGPVTPQQVSEAANDWLHKSGTGSTFHSLRHFAGSEGIESEDIRVVQEFLGHANPATTAIYTAVNPRRIAAMVDRFRKPNLETADDQTGCEVIHLDEVRAAIS
jgi:integrase